MRLHVIILLFCLVSILAVTSSRELKQVKRATDGETKVNPSRVLLQLESTANSEGTNNNPTCGAPRSREAMNEEGRLNVLNNIRNPSACCAACQGVPDSACRTWWRAQGSNQRCYLNSNRPRSS